MNTVLDGIRNELSPGEQVLWSGQPRQGVIVRGADAFLIPFSLLWGGFAIFWELSVIKSSGPDFFALFGIPFVLVGIYFIVGRFFVDAKIRAKTFYAVTDQRVLFVSGVFARRVKSLNLRTLSDLALSEGKSGVGTITFGAGSPLASMYDGLYWPAWYLGSRFDAIPNARSVFEIIRAAQRASA